MHFLVLYKQKQYHKIVLCGSACESEMDTICLILSLVGIGRQKAAVNLLRGEAETTTDPNYKISLLLCLHELTQSHVYRLEAKYWQSLGVFNDRFYQILKPLPSIRGRDGQDCAEEFLVNGAYS